MAHADAKAGKLEDFVMVSTDHDVSFFKSVPTNGMALASPTLCYPLTLIKVAQVSEDLKSSSSSNGAGDAGSREEAGIQRSRHDHDHDHCILNSVVVIQLPGGLRHLLQTGSYRSASRWVNVMGHRATMLRRSSAVNDQAGAAAGINSNGRGNAKQNAFGGGSGIACQTVFQARTIPGGLAASITVDWQLGIWFDYHVDRGNGNANDKGLGSSNDIGGSVGKRFNVPFDQLIRVERGRRSALTFVVQRHAKHSQGRPDGGRGGKGSSGSGNQDLEEEMLAFEARDASGLTSAVAAANATHLSSLQWLESIRC